MLKNNVGLKTHTPTRRKTRSHDGILGDLGKLGWGGELKWTMRDAEYALRAVLGQTKRSLSDGKLSKIACQPDRMAGFGGWYGRLQRD